MPQVRVAALQFAVTEDVAENLATCLRMVDQAAAGGAEVVVLPEFCNHVSWYAGREHAREKAVTLDGEFVAALAERAARHRIHLMANCTLLREDGRVSGSNILLGPDGTVLAVSDKQVLMGSERDHIDSAVERSTVVDTPVGRVGLYSCMDGVINETPRMLAVEGAQLLLNSVNSFALDEATLHVPVRAVENKVWVVAGNKVGPLVPGHSIAAVAERVGVPVERLHGAGEAQVVAPDGTVVAKGPLTGEAVVLADIDLAAADDKRRPDGTDVMAARRPEIYGPIAAAPRGRVAPAGAARAQAVVVAPAEGEDVAALLAAAVAERPDLVVLPELAAHDGGTADAAPAPELSIEALTALLAGSPTLVVTSVVDGGRHLGVVVGADGVMLEQPQLHRSARHAAWHTDLGDAVAVLDAPFGRLAVLVGDDALYPEAFRLAALQDADVVAVPFTVAAPHDLDLLLLERAAENRVNLVAGARRTASGLTGGAVPLSPDFTLWGDGWEGEFAGVISRPELVVATESLTRVVLRPECATNRFVSKGTDLVDGRPWALAAPLVTPAVAPV
ncbi:carbon-nitrogen hydrolase family protein [Nocardioides pantholopis]|uniref:carbon-nitrogen hydrolase family protein n=1 Tax=Nocardioides pantholopis TaxID=2483798 RepID=UPI0019D0D36F|nr:carbon-nitrogen hydrolase family protein [Nocardioides pantholopis]